MHEKSKTFSGRHSVLLCSLILAGALLCLWVRVPCDADGRIETGGYYEAQDVLDETIRPYAAMMRESPAAPAVSILNEENCLVRMGGSMVQCQYQIYHSMFRGDCLIARADAAESFFPEAEFTFQMKDTGTLVGKGADGTEHMLMWAAPDQLSPKFS